MAESRAAARKPGQKALVTAGVYAPTSLPSDSEGRAAIAPAIVHRLHEKAAAECHRASRAIESCNAVVFDGANPEAPTLLRELLTTMGLDPEHVRAEVLQLELKAPDCLAIVHVSYTEAVS